MIKYKLICKDCNSIFDSLFSNSKEYEKLKKKKYLNCHICDSQKIEKTLMAPNVLNSSLQWSEEASIWAMIWMVFIGSVVVVRRWEHIYIPTVVKLLPIKIRSLVIVFTKILVLIFLCVLCWYGWGIVTGHSNAFSHNIGVSTAWAKASVPIGCAMMVVITLGAIAEDLEAIFKKDWSRFEEYGSNDAV